MVELSDKEIILKIREGEIEEFSLIIKKYSHVIRKYISGKLFDKNETDDLVQETFLSFYKAISSFDESFPILPYLFQIAKNELKMYYRSKKQTVNIDELITIGKEDEYFFEKDEFEGLLKYVSDDQQRALKLLYEGYSYEEISQKLQRPLNTIRTLIRRARLKLVKQYEKVEKS